MVTQAEEERKKAFSILEKKLAEVAKEQEETKNQLTQMLQEQVGVNNDVTALSGMEVNLATDAVQTTDLTKLTFQTLPTSVISSQSASVFFDYLDSLKNGQNASIIEGAKNAYNEEGRAHRFKLVAAISYLKIAQITTNQVTERLTKEHHVQMKANRIAMEKKLAEVVKEQEETKNTAIVEGVEESKIMLGAGECVDIFSAPSTLPQHALGSETVFFNYLNTLKNGNNDSLIEGTKNVYTSSGPGHVLKLKSAITYLKVAQHVASVTGALQAQMVASQKK